MLSLKKTFTYLLAMVILYWLFFHLKSALGGELSPDLAGKLAQAGADQEVAVLIYLERSREVYPSATLGMNKNRMENYRSTVSQLRVSANFSQSGLSARLENWRQQGKVSRYKNYWIANAVAVLATKETLQELLALPEVEIIYPDYPVSLVAPVESKEALAASAEPDKIQVAIGAKEVWRQGLTGKGRLICLFDTGVDGTHPALSLGWRGIAAATSSSWMDPLGSSFPADASGHGTHVAGIICARTETDTIGIAPEAEWMAAAVVDRGTTKQTTVSNILDAFQWAMNPDGDINTFQDVPDVINNSWGFPKNAYPDCEEIFWQAIDNVEAAGIVVVFAAGNEGPERFTMRLPADRASSPYNSFSTGAVGLTDSGFQIASFSSRGPSRCDSTRAKPELSAPGVNIYSTYLNGQYHIMSGTSMAAPFVSAAAAILRQLDPEISVQEIKEALTKTATDLGEPGQDNDYGAGVINIAAAVNYWKKVKGLDAPASIVPKDFSLGQNYPNPFNAGTTIKYEAKPTSSPFDKVSLKVYNILGQEVRTLVEEPQGVGFYTVDWDGTDNRGGKVASGLYFYRLAAGEFTQTRKMALVK